MSCHRKIFLVTERSFLSEVKMSCNRKEFHTTVRNFSSQEEISFHRKKFLVTGRNFLSEVKMSSHRKNGPLLIHADKLLLAAMNKYWKSDDNGDGTL